MNARPTLGSIGTRRTRPYDLNVVCPRCGTRLLPDHPGSMSRTDGATEICDECGMIEALDDFAGRKLAPPEEWPVG
jgi:predicted RNA-binding Zn-ribbon protein involved in translation (DUF1610 family)